VDAVLLLGGSCGGDVCPMPSRSVAPWLNNGSVEDRTASSYAGGDAVGVVIDESLGGNLGGNLGLGFPRDEG